MLNIYRKHQLQHTKPYRCIELDCLRTDGFATQNDLQRHRASVHCKIPLVGKSAGFVCVACNSTQTTQAAVPKFWPRRDNFKAHVKRKHPLEDLESVIRK